MIRAIEAEPELPESELEVRVAQLLEEYGFPKPVAQCAVMDDERVYAQRVDFAYPQQKVAIEADGRAFHHSREAWLADRDRGCELASAGWKVLRVTWDDLHGDRAVMFLERLERALKLERPAQAA